MFSTRVSPVTFTVIQKEARSREEGNIFVYDKGKKLRTTFVSTRTKLGTFFCLQSIMTRDQSRLLQKHRQEVGTWLHQVPLFIVLFDTSNSQFELFMLDPY